MITFTRGASVIHDESSGLQNLTVTPNLLGGDYNDNDILFTSVPSDFSSRLAALIPGDPDPAPLGAALSGYTGAAGNTGSNAFTLSGVTGTVTDIKFVKDASGGAFTGQDSDLDTAGGLSVFLYTDPLNNNILLGRAGTGMNGSTPDANGTIVFAAYIDETKDANNKITGGKLWIVQYQALKHPNDPTDPPNFNNPDNAVNLLNKVFIGVDQDTSFVLDGAPSGQNLFLMFTTGSPTIDANGRIAEASIIATGKTPVIGANGQFTNTSDTVNTSQAGGPTTFGTNSQMITEEEGIRYTFVTGGRANVTIPNLDQNEADVEANIDFTGMFNARSAKFDVVQLQSGKSAQVKITALNTAVESGTGFVAGYDNDTTVPITANSVTVTPMAPGDPAFTGTITYNADGSVLIKGVLAKQTINYTTSTDHNRVLIENGAALNASGNTHADFDIGGFKLLQTTVAALEIGSQMVFEDDGPAADVVGSGQSPAPLQVDDDTLGTDATIQSAPLFALGTGLSDGSDSRGTLTTAFTIELNVLAGSPSGLVDLATGENVLLYLQAGKIVGLAGVGGPTVFEVRIDGATGAVTLDQQRVLSHPTANDPNEFEQLDLQDAVLVKRTDTLVDKDGDRSVDSATANISLTLQFFDSGPSAAGTAQTGTVDEDGLANGIAGGTGDVAGELTTASGSVSGIFLSGADTPLSYGLSSDTTALQALSSGGTALVYSVAGNTLTAKAGVGGANVFTFAITDTATGAYTFTLLKPLDHAAGNAENDITVNLGTVVQATDKDGDTVTASAEKVAILVDDDTPTLAFGNLVGTGTTLPQYGFYTKAAGADGPNASDLQIALTGFQLGGDAQAAANFSLTEGSPSPDSSTNYNWSGSLKGDFDSNAATPDTTLAFTLTALANGKYALDLAAPVQSSTTTDTASGGLGAGGPDPVQTLFIPPAPAVPTETVVFFSAKIGATAASIASGITLGQPDPTEASLEGGNPPTTLAAFIDPRNMNVSTAGIGVDNNNLNGYGASGSGAIIDDPAGSQPSDDSFVVNPGTLVDKVRVFIDNSVTGYDYTGGERLQYRIFFDNGDVSDYTTVVGDLGKGALPKFFEIDGGGRKIDAVQLTMLYGEIKIPNIQFVTLTESLAKDIGLDFTASLTDKDGDTVSTNFSADLFANKAASATLDYDLIGTALAADAFDVDLASTRNDYQISGFDTAAGARDKIVLLGDATAQVSFVNGPTATDSSIVTITETGGQITTLTVVGVDLQAGDIVFGP